MLFVVGYIPSYSHQSVGQSKMLFCSAWAYDSQISFYPAAGWGTGYCFRAICIFVSLFVSLSARLRENGWTDLHEIFREGVE